MNATEFARKIDEILKRLDVLEATAHISYDKGTYVPTYLGGTTAGVTTYSLQAGFYTRQGNLVTCWGAVVWTAATGTGTALISLPFTATATANANFSGGARTTNVTFANSTPQVQFAASATAWSMVSPLTNAGGAAVAIEAAGNIIWTIEYAIDA